MVLEKSRGLRGGWLTAWLFLWCVHSICLRTVAYGNPAEGLAPGLLVTLTSSANETAREVTVTPNLRLYVPGGESAAPFLPHGPFTAVWEGFLSLDFRGQYQFEADVNGTFQLELNGETVLKTSGETREPGKSIRLNRGTNALRAVFTSPENGGAFVRLSWIPRNSFSRPVPDGALSHESGSADLALARKLRRGRALLVERQCLKCHKGPEAGMRELAMDAPGFEGIGARLNFDWIQQWLLDPGSFRESASMPKLMHGPHAGENAAAIAAFLSSQTGPPRAAPREHPDASLSVAGKKLFEALQCAACHESPELEGRTPEKISLRHVRQKFAPGALVDFLRAPEAHYAWTRMPRYKLAEVEWRQLAAFLLERAEETPRAMAPSEPGILQRGKELVQTTGCLNCHSLSVENRFQTKLLAELPAERWHHGCVADQRDADSLVPDFGFAREDREALRVFAQTDRRSLERDVPVEFAGRQIRALDCAACHGTTPEFPPLEILGGQLKPEWAKAFLRGEISAKPRPWLKAQMPAFPAYAEGLAYGMAMQHGYPLETPAEPAVDLEAVNLGRRLVSASAGFACVACHGIGTLRAPTVEEGIGINLAESGARLQRDFFMRWLRQPSLIDPQTKMPVYFDEQGRSPLADVLDGSAEKQMEAMWHYIRLGEQMPAPEE
jgi:mono/diheme cytochrome c family protein